MFIQLIADYGKHDPAYAEVIQKFKQLDPAVDINPVNVPKFSTLGTGFWMAQLSYVNSFPGLVIFSNTAPRIAIAADETKTYRGKYGQLSYALLDNEIPVIGVHVGYNFSFLKTRIKKFHLIHVENTGSQFRSRDFYPEGVLGVMNDPQKYIGEEIPLDSIPSVPINRIAFIDGYGNIKTSVRKSQSTLDDGTKVGITLNGMTKSAVIGGETYHVQDGELCFAPGSAGGDDKFMEIWVKGESAWHEFGKPNTEVEFSIKPL